MLPITRSIGLPTCVPLVKHRTQGGWAKREPVKAWSSKSDSRAHGVELRGKPYTAALRRIVIPAACVR